MPSQTHQDPNTQTRCLVPAKKSGTAPRPRRRSSLFNTFCFVKPEYLLPLVPHAGPGQISRGRPAGPAGPPSLTGSSTTSQSLGSKHSAGRMYTTTSPTAPPLNTPGLTPSSCYGDQSWLGTPPALFGGALCLANSAQIKCEKMSRLRMKSPRLFCP